MNLLHTPIGGFKLYLDDIDYLQDNVKIMLEAHLSRLTVFRSNFIYSGCKIIFDSGNNLISCSDGWVVVEGELLKFESQSVTPSSFETNYKFVLEQTDDPDGVKINDDGFSFFAYKKRRAVLEEVSTPNSTIDSYFSFDNDTNRVWNYSDVINGKLINLSMQDGWSFTSTLAFRKDIDGMIHITGDAIHTSAVTSGNFATLPEGSRPESIIRGMYVMDSSRVTCFVYPDGVIKFLYPAFENGSFIIPPFKGV